MRIRMSSLILMYIGLLCLISSASPAFANDLKIPVFDRDINKNGTFFGNAGTLWYSPSMDTISADFVLETSWECEPDPADPTICIENRPAFQALISVQSETFSFELGYVQILPEEVQFRNPGSGMPPQTQQKLWPVSRPGRQRVSTREIPLGFTLC